MQTRTKLLTLLLIPIAILVSYLYGLFPDSWERFYSLGINKWFIKILSSITGIFPFSLFEWGIYIGVITLIGYTLYTLFRIFTHLDRGLKIFLNYLLNLGVSASILFFIFIVGWAANYKRPHFSEKYGIVMADYTPEQLGELYSYLLDQAGKIREELPEDENGNAIPYGDHQDIFRRAQAGYDIAGQAFEALNGHYGKAKAVFASPLMNYTGITGIYSPFTGEPNINIAVPPITIPSTTCHEMAHQRGYGFESECNFIAYITSMANPDLDFQYSAYIMAISYTSNALAQADREILLSINATMSDKVYKDLVNINEFWDSYKGGVKETAEQINNAYLQSNGVESGTESYGEMVNLLLALYDKYH